MEVCEFACVGDALHVSHAHVLHTGEPGGVGKYGSVEGWERKGGDMLSLCNMPLRCHYKEYWCGCVGYQIPHSIQIKVPPPPPPSARPTSSILHPTPPHPTDTPPPHSNHASPSRCKLDLELVLVPLAPYGSTSGKRGLHSLGGGGGRRKGTRWQPQR